MGLENLPVLVVPRMIPRRRSARRGSSHLALRTTILLSSSAQGSGDSKRAVQSRPRPARGEVTAQLQAEASEPSS